MGLLDGKVAIVTGAGQGLGRVEALELARHGARVVVNDLGTTADGTGASEAPARSVVAEIEALGGKAVAAFGDVADFEAAAAHRPAPPSTPSASSTSWSTTPASPATACWSR